MSHVPFLRTISSRRVARHNLTEFAALGMDSLHSSADQTFLFSSADDSYLLGSAVCDQLSLLRATDADRAFSAKVDRLSHWLKTMFVESACSFSLQRRSPVFSEFINEKVAAGSLFWSLAPSVPISSQLSTQTLSLNVSTASLDVKSTADTLPMSLLLLPVDSFGTLFPAEAVLETCRRQGYDAQFNFQNIQIHDTHKQLSRVLSQSAEFVDKINLLDESDDSCIRRDVFCILLQMFTVMLYQNISDISPEFRSGLRNLSRLFRADARGSACYCDNNNFHTMTCTSRQRLVSYCELIYQMPSRLVFLVNNVLQLLPPCSIDETRDHNLYHHLYRMLRTFFENVTFPKRDFKKYAKRVDDGFSTLSASQQVTLRFRDLCTQIEALYNE
jgi:hypothetical protein